MKLLKLVAALLLCGSLFGCSSNKKITMEEVDYKLGEAGYETSIVTSADNTPLDFEIKKLNVTITFKTDKKKLSSIKYTDELSEHQYVVDVTNNTEMAIITHEDKTCMYDIADGKKQENPKVCGKTDEQFGKKMHDDFYAFLKEIGIDLSELIEYYNWSITE